MMNFPVPIPITVLMASFLGTASQLLAQSLPQALVLGTWQVTSVLTDNGAVRTMNYQFNDPRLKGRIVVASASTITTNLPEDRRCISPTVEAERTTAGALIAATMATRSGGSVPSAEDYRLGVASGVPVDIPPRCGQTPSDFCWPTAAGVDPSKAASTIAAEDFRKVGQHGARLTRQDCRRRIAGAAWPARDSSWHASTASG